MKRKMSKDKVNSRKDQIIKDKSKVMAMDGKSPEPFQNKAKKPLADAKPTGFRPRSTNKNMKKTDSKYAKRLTGLML